MVTTDVAMCLHYVFSFSRGFQPRALVLPPTFAGGAH